ncbi:MAG: iron-containing alcohol dehydrogenase [Clostridia bacterium]|nr:iron-containing alcohol dehydrogenase [Clostridia bacterium]
MPIREKSFRIGCGRYLQEVGILQSCGEEVMRVGHAPLIVSGKTALQLTRQQIESSVRAQCPHYHIEEYRGTCNDENASVMVQLARRERLDVIIGVGGGVMMDFAKLIGRFASLPVINIPTSSATCAAYTPLSVRYTPDGCTVGSLHHEREVDAVLADPAIIATQPTRLLLSGVFDALAKFVEIKQRYREGGDCPLGLDFAYEMSKYSFRLLSEKTATCIADLQAGTVSADFESLVFTTIAATGVISGIARGSNQCALAHKFYEITRKLFNRQALPYLHGEIVGVGLLLQNRFNSETEKNGELLELMRRHGMPHRVTDVGVPCTEESFCEYYNRLRDSSAIDETNADECARLNAALRYLWEMD